MMWSVQLLNDCLIFYNYTFLWLFCLKINFVRKISKITNIVQLIILNSKSMFDFSATQKNSLISIHFHFRKSNFQCRKTYFLWTHFIKSALYSIEILVGRCFKSENVSKFDTPLNAINRKDQLYGYSFCPGE